MTARPRVVLLGGTFDPVHLGHLSVAEQARAQLGADQVWLIPAAVPPHRPTPEAGPEARLALLNAAVQGQPHLRVDDLELRRGGISYTSDTVATLAAARPDVEQWFLLGADAAREIRGWHGLGDLLRAARFVLVNREGVGELTAAEAVAIGFDGDRLQVIAVDSPPISASRVREQVWLGRPLDGLVPPAVAALIEQLGLYRGARGEGVGR